MTIFLNKSFVKYNCLFLIIFSETFSSEDVKFCFLALNEAIFWQFFEAVLIKFQRFSIGCHC